MAPRRGDQRLLARPAVTAGAGAVLLALAVGAALALSGCGGSSGSSTTATAEAARSASDGAKAPSGARGTASPPAAGKKRQSEALPGGGGEGGSKHGKRIAQPTGKREQAPTPADIAKATVADMTLQSPALIPSAEGPATLPATYTCDGKNTWPTLRWGGVPTGTTELILYAMSVAPVGGKLFVDWALAGLDPGLEGLESGKLPKGAITGNNSFGQRGYSICPSGSEVYFFAAYALPESLSLSKGFDARETRKRILDVSGNVGLLAVGYARG